MKKTAILIFAAIILAVAGYSVAGDLARDGYGTAIQGALYPQTAQSISISGTTARNSSNLVSPVIRVVSTANCFIKFGSSTVEATSTDHYLPAGATEYFLRRSSTRIGAITTGATGTLYISEMN